MNLSANNNASDQLIANINANIINRYQSGQLQVEWANNSLCNGSSSSSVSIHEPGNFTTVTLGVISRLVLVTPPASCRSQCRCDTQPVLKAYDASGNAILKLGSDNQPWQVVGTVLGSANVSVYGAIANYSDEQTQYSMFGVTATGSYQIQFSFITPSDVNSSFVATVNLTVTNPILSAIQSDDVSVVSKNETFNMTVLIVDQISKTRIADIHWGGFSWTATVSLYTSLQYQSNGSLIAASTSTAIVNLTAGTVTATNLEITEIGMYVFSMTITSSNNQYSILFTKGSVVNSFIVDGSTSDVAAVLTMGAVTITTTGQNALNGQTISSCSVDDVLYTSNSSSSSTSGGKNAGLIAGITVRVVAGVALIAGGVLRTMKIFMVPTGQPLLNNGPDDAPLVLTQPEPTNGNTANSSTSNTAPNNNANRAHSPLSTNSNGQRNVSGLSAASTIDLFLSGPATTPSTPNAMPPFKLLNLEHH
ncbi:unnamed protein product [Rotaria socialis]|uniref:Transmembrane protein n=1 Tax=Rotaria socialis TaxID=392032 RepID=A0A818TNE1_9BILA|nr:unnamed protein product [Rotaria socialis]CAF4409809.1 unnamed protein product [Rotaria socialis]